MRNKRSNEKENTGQDYNVENAMKLVNERYNVKNEIEAYAALYEELKSYC